MSAMADYIVGKLETSPGRRTMKIRAEHAKRANEGSRSLAILSVITDLTVQNANTRLYTKAPASMWVLPRR
jgi:hypothetical protein